MEFRSQSGGQNRLRMGAAGSSVVAVLFGLCLSTHPAGAQQVFNGSQTTPNGAINGGGGVWDTTITNWSDVFGSTSSAYDPASAGTIFGYSGVSTPATAGTVTVAPSGVQLTGLVGFDLTADNSVYTIQGGDLRLASGGTMIFTNDVTGTADPSAVIASRITGSGGINVQGPGILALIGANTYAGDTFICACAALQLGDATHTASIIGAVVNDGLFNVVNADTSGITSLLNGLSGVTMFLNATSASSMIITNNGQLYFGDPFGTGIDTATAGRATITNDGSIGFFGRTNAGSASITNQSGGITAFIDQASAGSATIVNKDFGGTSFGAVPGSTATADNATIINDVDGQTAFGALSTAGNATIITKDGGATKFYDNSTGGNARFITTGTGIVDFGISLGPHGDGRITAGSIEGNGTYYIGGGNTLAVGSNNRSMLVDGVIGDYDPCGCGFIGSGSLEKVGSGTLILSGTNTYTGTTTVNGGILRVDGDISQSSLTTVKAGGALFGAGIVGNTTIAAGGIYAPGDGGPGSSMAVLGDLAFQSGALYLVQVGSGTTASFANVFGNAGLNGTVGVSLYAGSTILPQYKIMQFSGAATDNFAGVAAPGGLIGTTTVDPAGTVYLNFTLDYGAKYALNVNQKNVATTLQNFFNANGFLQAEFAGLGPAGLTQASGEPATGSQQATFSAMNLFLGLLTDVFGSGRSGTPGATPFRRRDERERVCRDRQERTRRPCLDLSQGAAGEFRTTLGRVGCRLWWLADQRRQCRPRLKQHQQQRLRDRRRPRLPLLAVDDRRLCACGRGDRLQRQRARLGPLRSVPGRRLRASYRRTSLYHGRAGLWLAGRHDQPHRHRRGCRSVACAVQRQRALGPYRGRLSPCLAVDRPHALCGAPGHRVQPSELFRVRGGRQQRLRAELCRQGRDQHPHRARPARGQVIRRGRRPDDSARPRRLGA
ncbi:autotransporter-associated beta strand protein [Bradyrhizobium sp. LM3.6]